MRIGRQFILFCSCLFPLTFQLKGADADSPANRYKSYPAPAQYHEGISWPAGQALPHFAAPDSSLDAIDVQALDRDEQITFSALQGQVNKKKPRIYLLYARAEEGGLTWAQTATINFNIGTFYHRETKYDLLAKYTNEIEGAVLYDPFVSPHYRNLAGTIAGLHRALPLAPPVEEQCRQHGIHLKTLVDLRGLTNSSPTEIYDYLLTNYWDQCTKRLLLSARPTNRGGDFHHTRDLAAACRARRLGSI